MSQLDMLVQKLSLPHNCTRGSELRRLRAAHRSMDIRQRALRNIVSKLEAGLVALDDLAVSFDLCGAFHERIFHDCIIIFLVCAVNLLEWFNRPDFSHAEDVLRILLGLARVDANTRPAPLAHSAIQHRVSSRTLLEIGAVEFLSDLQQHSQLQPWVPLIDPVMEALVSLEPADPAHTSLDLYPGETVRDDDVDSGSGSDEDDDERPRGLRRACSAGSDAVQAW